MGDDCCTHHMHDMPEAINNGNCPGRSCLRIVRSHYGTEHLVQLRKVQLQCMLHNRDLGGFPLLHNHSITAACIECPITSNEYCMEN